nr:amino acid permease-like protein [Tanacetum cinerariifolium]
MVVAPDMGGGDGEGVVGFNIWVLDTHRKRVSHKAAGPVGINKHLSRWSDTTLNNQCGGPFGIDYSVRAAGPFLAIIGFLVFLVIWSVPEALITAEWALSDGYPRIVAIVALTVALTYMNFRGTRIVGWVAAFLAMIVGGAWLRWWVQVVAGLSNMGMFVTELSSDSFQLLGMAKRGMLPEFFAKRSRYGTPYIGILYSASGVILLSQLTFQEIVAAEIFLYCFGMILEFIAFVLRMKYPAVSRPYKIPVGITGAVLMCVPPPILIFVVLALSTFKVMGLSVFSIVIGLVLQPFLKYIEKKR